MWNQPAINNLSKEHDLKQCFTFHRTNIKKIKQELPSSINQDLPLHPSFLDRDLKERRTFREWDLSREYRNGLLIKKMIEINNNQSEYNPKKLHKQGEPQKKTLNIGARILDMKKIMKENEFLEKRLQTVSGTISNKKIKNDFSRNENYKWNISKHSRRIVNCLMHKGHSQSKSLNRVSPDKASPE